MDAIKTRGKFISQELSVVRGISVEDQIQGFRPLYLRSIVPEVKLSFALYIKTLEGGSNRANYVILYNADEVFQNVWLGRLQQMGVDRLYFRQEDLDLVIDYLNEYLFSLDSQGVTATPQKLRVMVDHLNLSMQQAFANLDFGKYVSTTSRQIDRLLTELEEGLLPVNFLWELLNRDYTLYYHTINVFLLAMALMVHLRRKRSECHTMGIAALFHDTGMTKIRGEILSKPELLDPDDWDEIKKHPNIGSEIIRKCVAIPLDVPQLIREHHENADGSGYPLGLNLLGQHPDTPILRLLDAFAALTANRPYRPAYSAFQAVKIIKDQNSPQGLIFDQRLLAKFVRLLAL